MSQQQLFNVGKVPVFIETYNPSVEKRGKEETQVITVKCKIQPFNALLASALDEGVGGDSNIKATVFNLSTAEPKPNFTRHDFKLALDRQNLEIYSTPDSPTARIALLQAKISGTYVRTQKDNRALALVFKATFGPVGRDELHIVHSLHRSQAFISFSPAEPLLEMEDDGDDEGNDADIKAREVVNGRPLPEWDDEDGERPPASESNVVPMDTANRPLHSHQTKNKRKKKTH